jgi:hypothetical protein
MTAFNPIDTATWPAVLTPEHVAEIYTRSVVSLKKACQRGTFQPAPYKVKPYRWRRVDVLRDVEGQRGFGQLRRVG